MYEARLGAFDYTIERCLLDDGGRSWRWRVLLGGELVAAGETPRSHVYAETVVQSFIFLAEANESAGGDRSAGPLRTFG
jgi:hypothetical protein